MPTDTGAIKAHYFQAGLDRRILSALEAAQVAPEALSREVLAAFDEFHIGGRGATRELAQLAGLRPLHQVLDIGCGIGGPARTLAAEFGCRVTGMDLVFGYCRTARLLSGLAGMPSGIAVCCANAAALPFVRRTFDAVVTQHVIMNVRHKQRLLSEIRRVLRPGGRWALYEVCAGEVSPPHFPLPWAGGPQISFLSAPEDFRRMLAQAGFVPGKWQDVSAVAAARLKKAAAARRKRPDSGRAALSLRLLMGAAAGRKSANLVRSLEEGRLRVIRAVMETTPTS